MLWGVLKNYLEFCAHISVIDTLWAFNEGMSVAFNYIINHGSVYSGKIDNLVIYSISQTFWGLNATLRWLQCISNTFIVAQSNMT